MHCGVINESGVDCRHNPTREGVDVDARNNAPQHPRGCGVAGDAFASGDCSRGGNHTQRAHISRSVGDIELHTHRGASGG